MAEIERPWLRRTGVFLLPLFLAAAAFWLLANMNGDGDGEVQIEGGRWQLIALRRSPVPPEGAPYFEVTDGTIAGYDGCNQFGGPLAEPGKIRRGQRGCPENYTPLPLDLNDPQGHLAEATFSEGRLILRLEDDETAEFERRSAE